MAVAGRDLLIWHFDDMVDARPRARLRTNDGATAIVIAMPSPFAAGIRDGAATPVNDTSIGASRTARPVHRHMSARRRGRDLPRPARGVDATRGLIAPASRGPFLGTHAPPPGREFTSVPAAAIIGDGRRRSRADHRVGRNASATPVSGLHPLTAPPASRADRGMVCSCCRPCHSGELHLHPLGPA